MSYRIMFADDVGILYRHIKAAKRTYLCPKCHMAIIQTGSFIIRFHAIIDYILFLFKNQIYKMSSIKTAYHFVGREILEMFSQSFLFEVHSLQ